LGYGADMSPGTSDPNTSTQELLPVVASDSGRVGGDAGVSNGRARPVIMSDRERALLWESDDPTVIPERFPHPRRMPSDGRQTEAPAGMDSELNDLQQPGGEAPTRLHPARIVANGVGVAILAVIAILVVALMMVLATR